MNKNITTLAIDLDGTITDEDGNIPENVVGNIRYLISIGILFIVCTARDIDNVIGFLKKYFENEEICKFGFVTSSGSHVYKVVLIKDNLKFKIIYAFEFNIEKIRGYPKIQSFLELHKEKLLFKNSALLIPFRDSETALNNLREIKNLIDGSYLKAYLYHRTLVISLKSFDKDKGLKIFMNKYEIRNSELLRLADQGDKDQADFEFLNFKNGFTVGSKNMKEKYKCNYVLNERGKILTGVSASNYIFKKLISILQNKNTSLRRNVNHGLNSGRSVN